jgi:3-oxoacyl-[acyl-carrier protein] reductase
MDLAQDFKDKVVLITGSSRGIGKACAKAFSDVGCRVIIHYSRNEAAAMEAKKFLNTKTQLIQADLSHESGCKKLISEAGKTFGKIDSLVINHGIWERGEIDKITANEINRTIDLNLKSIFYLTRETIPFFPVNKGGSIVLISSTAGQRGEANYSQYAASKGGVIALTKSLAVELAPRKIRVNSVAPGWVKTDMANDVLQGDYLKEIIATIPLRKIAEAEDIAPSVVFLASNYANHITGEILNVNGGSVLCG